MSPYRAPRWLKGGHAQTIWPAVGIRQSRPPYRRELWPTPDGGEVAVDFVDGPLDAPLVVLFHGLEGSSDSHYALSLMTMLAEHGWRGAVPHFRGCGGVGNTLRRAYHAGDSAEVAWLLEKFAGLGQPLFAAGVSLGGNMLLKYLGETGTDALPLACAAVSVPVDLAAASTRLDVGFGRHVYTRLFLGTLKPKALSQLIHHPGLFDADGVRRARTFGEFDNLVTAPLHGYRDVRDYWTRASSKPLLRHIARPTLLLNAVNDPFLPPDALPKPHEVSAAVRLEQPAEGGHVGFVTGSFPGRLDWLPERLIAFFEEQLAAGRHNDSPENHVRHPEQDSCHQA
ncbi:YheT family hydrolase [Crenobacter cavernae]|uniref:Alpha/beta fold hydrolase n=1 Tax=Crenobacter cavernae TaxID=2290923 RepID=A0A345Y8G1_9NEIS|nr:alpha/beta fold hydrolase [Crenobacter cavernae]AXK40213.1 alpha/beta fold hydrolase [Crenobacter cavernae]